MAYDIYPAVDPSYNFPPEVRTALVQSTDVQNALNAARDAAISSVLGAFSGVVTPFAGAVAPTGWLLCNGQTVSRTDYAKLFAAIGTTYGIGDGATTFNVPNLKGKMPVGLDTTQTEFNALAKTGGEKTHNLSITEIPSHNHGVNDPGHNHSQNSHGHGVTDPGHGHGLYDPGHGHGVYDPGHGHGSTTLDGFQTYQTNTATRREIALSGVASSARTLVYAIASSGSNAGVDYGTARNSGTGIGINGSGTGMSVYGNSTGVSINYGTASNNPSGTGISTQNNGGSTAHNVLQPYVTMNYIIHA